MQIKRLFDIPYYQLENSPKQDCFGMKVNGEWETTSTQELVDNMNLVSKGLLQLGVEPGDKIALISSSNRPEWNTMDMGILQIGAVDVPVYPTITENDYKFIFNDAEVKLCFVSDEELLKKILSIKHEIPTLEDIYVFDEVKGAKNWKELMELGRSGDQEKLEQIKEKIDENDLATLIYTSGTTGVPKGVMLSHKNIVHNAIACIPRLPVDKTSRALSFLPVCHIYERMIHYLYLQRGVSIYFAESMDTISENLKEVKPDGFTAVPRLLEKVYDKIVAKGSELSGFKKKLFDWSLDLGHRYELNYANGLWFALQLWVARRLVFKKWKEALGGNVKVIASGSAALQPRLARVFTAAGIPIMEGYGLTETSPVVSVSSQFHNGVMFGTVGKVIDSMEVKIASDGEILVKGPCVMMGYYNREDLTNEVIDEDGWFHTGDIGELVNGEFLKITDRKKEIFKTSGGKYIVPQVMENKFKESPFIEQIIVIGENKKHSAALIVPAFDYIKEWCRQNDIDCNSNEDIIINIKVKEQLSIEVDTYNQHFGHWEQIKKFELLEKEWTVEGGELTPTLKLKRKNIHTQNQSVIEKIYETSSVEN